MAYKPEGFYTHNNRVYKYKIKWISDKLVPPFSIYAEDQLIFIDDDEPVVKWFKNGRLYK